jgi:hypothetical protein
MPDHQHPSIPLEHPDEFPGEAIAPDLVNAPSKSVLEHHPALHVPDRSPVIAVAIFACPF